jgi:hypothetical protein
VAAEDVDLAVRRRLLSAGPEQYYSMPIICLEWCRLQSANCKIATFILLTSFSKSPFIPSLPLSPNPTDSLSLVADRQDNQDEIETE